MKPARQTRPTSRDVQFAHERAIVVVARRPAAMADGQTPRCRRAAPFQPGRILSIGDDDRDRGVEPPVANGVDQRLQVAAASRDQDAKAAIHEQTITDSCR